MQPAAPGLRSTTWLPLLEATEETTMGRRHPFVCFLPSKRGVGTLHPSESQRQLVQVHGHGENT